MQNIGEGSEGKREEGEAETVKPVVEEQREPLLSKATPLSNIPSSGMIAISYMAGTISKTEVMRFKKIVYRTTRGKALTYFNDLDTSGLQDYAGALD